MTDEEKAARYAAEEAQRLINEADRPRIRALELARKADPAYHSRQMNNPLGIWRVDGSTVDNPSLFGRPPTQEPPAVSAPQREAT